MIDFTNARFIKLAGVDPSKVISGVQHILTEGENPLIAAKGSRDYVIFTNKRVIVVNVQGLSGNKQDITSLPLNKIQAWSIEGAGTFDRDAELDMWFSGLGHVKLEFASGFDLPYVARLIGWAVLPSSETVSSAKV